jgi:hypothetical protein
MLVVAEGTQESLPMSREILELLGSHRISAKALKTS